MEGGGEEDDYIPITTHCHHQNDFCIKMGSDESHFNVSVGSDGQSHKTVSTNHNLFEEKGELKRYQTQVLPLTKKRLTARPNQLTRWFDTATASYRSWSEDFELTLIQKGGKEQQPNPKK